MASGLSKKVSAIECAIALLAHLHDRLRFLQPPVDALLRSAAELPQLAQAGYLTACLASMAEGEPFPESFRRGVAECPGALGDEECALLAGLSDVLGATDLESQLAALAYTREELERRLAVAREAREKYHKLYTTLGLLSGLAIAIILV